MYTMNRPVTSHDPSFHEGGWSLVLSNQLEGQRLQRPSYQEAERSRATRCLARLEQAMTCFCGGEACRPVASIIGVVDACGGDRAGDQLTIPRIAVQASSLQNFPIDIVSQHTVFLTIESFSIFKV